MINILTNLRSNRKGGVMVELGVSIPLVFALCMAAGDFARIFYHALTAQGAAAQAAFYGSQTTGQTGDLTGMIQRATDDKGPLGTPLSPRPNGAAARTARASLAPNTALKPAPDTASRSPTSRSKCRTRSTPWATIR